MTEKLTRLVNRDEADDVVYSHHGSLSREVRSVVEERLKAGRLAGIVATSSLELGIDIGTLDEVVMVQTPPAVSSALQRLGRAGHRVGDVSRGRIYPTFARDYIHAAVVARAVLDQEIEELRPIVAPLDVLAQVILSMAVAEAWDIDDLYAFLRSCAPYHSLGRREYELVLEMLAGRYADSGCASCVRALASTGSTTRCALAPGPIAWSTSLAARSPIAATISCAWRAPVAVPPVVPAPARVATAAPVSASSTRSSCGSARSATPSLSAPRAGASARSPTTMCW